MRCSREIRARMEAGSIGKKSRRPERTPEDDGSLAVELRRFGVRE